MNAVARARDPDRERKERIGFVILQHLLTLWSEEESARSPAGIATDLAIAAEEVSQILCGLTYAGLVCRVPSGGAALLTPKGAEYVRREARRRRSVRVFTYRR